MSGTVETKLEGFSAVPIFPTMIWASQLKPDVTSRINSAFAEVLDNARRQQAGLDPKGKWQTDQRLHTLPELAE
ncbi:MAG: hypothetical protein OEU49_13645, partial [Chromatiales bacterium]|nr:hypothetical protein [Chromatiales bacterium]